MFALSLRHTTRYSYRTSVGFGEHRMMFRPREGVDQRVIASRLIIVPEPIELRFTQDLFGNWVGLARFDAQADELMFDSHVMLEHTANAAAEAACDLIRPLAARFDGYGEDEADDLSGSIRTHFPDPDGGSAAMGLQVFIPLRPHRRTEGAVGHDASDSRRVPLRSAARGRMPSAAGDLAPAPRQLPRFRVADDGGGAQPRPRRSLLLRLYLL